MAAWEEDSLDQLTPQEQLKTLIELRHRFQTLVNQEVWAELCEIALGQIKNLMQEAEALPFGLDSMLQRECIRARAQGVEQLIKTPESFIEDLTDTIDALDREVNGAQESEE